MFTTERPISTRSWASPPTQRRSSLTSSVTCWWRASTVPSVWLRLSMTWPTRWSRSAIADVREAVCCRRPSIVPPSPCSTLMRLRDSSLTSVWLEGGEQRRESVVERGQVERRLGLVDRDACRRRRAASRSVSTPCLEREVAVADQVEEADLGPRRPSSAARPDLTRKVTSASLLWECLTFLTSPTLTPATRTSSPFSSIDARREDRAGTSYRRRSRCCP